MNLEVSNVPYLPLIRLETELPLPKDSDNSFLTFWKVLEEHEVLPIEPIFEIV